MSWELEDGLALVRSLQSEAKKFGYHIALGGSVLNAGYSDKDVDLYFLPLNNRRYPKGSHPELVLWLSSLWGTPVPIGLEYEDEGPWSEYTIKLVAGAGPNGEDMFTRIPREPRTYGPPPSSVFTGKYKFLREAGDRIDVFIL